MRLFNSYQRFSLPIALIASENTYIASDQPLINSTSPLGTFSCWLKRNLAGQVILCEALDSDNKLALRISIDGTGNFLSFELRRGESRLLCSSTINSLMPDSKWHHILISWDSSNLDLSKRGQLYIDDTNIHLTFAASQIPFVPNITTKNWRFLSSALLLNNKLDIAIGALYLNFKDSLDVSAQLVRRKFINPYLKPAKLEYLPPAQLFLSFAYEMFATRKAGNVTLKTGGKFSLNSEVM